MINKAKDTAANTTDSSVRFQTPDQLRKYLMIWSGGGGKGISDFRGAGGVPLLST